MKYLDANVFIYPVLYEGAKAERGREILESIAEGRESYATSSLTLDEVAWKIISLKNERKEAIGVCADILGLSNLAILDVTGDDILKALWFMEKYSKLKPRDAIHLVVSFNAGIFTIITDDSDFDTIDEITRERLE